MADDQLEYMAGKAMRVGTRRASKDGNFESEEHQMLWYHNNKSYISGVSSGSGPKHQVYTNTSSSSSAPIAIPNWQKIYGTSHHDGHGLNNEESFNMYADEHEMIPPHVYIAKKLASSQISSFSVCEGAGRTLKGRDLRRVRNAILTKTGFLE